LINYKFLFIIFSATVFIIGCSPAPRYTLEKIRVPKEKTTVVPGEKVPIGTKYKGTASFYGKEYHGKTTSNGEVYDMNGLTCAHNTLAFDTWLEVKNLSNERTVVVRVNDRGPFVDNRIIDLSYGAAKEIHMLESGITEVEITVIK
jgi:rare lipoprotein A (peptidoglycan hydrolase)